MKYRLFIPFLMLNVLVAFSCAKQNLRNAEDSLRGTWQVTQVFMQIAGNESQEEIGDLGKFVFTADHLTYTYTRLDSIQSESKPWELVRTKENAGFSRVEVYILNLDDQSFRVAFGDETIDAEQDATEMSLTAENVDGFETVMLWLEKE